jgi:hypothetical protein
VIKKYIAFSLFAIILLSYVLLDISIKSGKIAKEQLAFTKCSAIVEPSLGSAILEDRFLLLKKGINNIYPLMPKIDKKGFVYAK